MMLMKEMGRLGGDQTPVLTPCKDRGKISIPVDDDVTDATATAFAANPVALLVVVQAHSTAQEAYRLVFGHNRKQHTHS